MGEEQKDTWYMVLEDYTRRDLTFPEKDKLAAIGGIAKRISALRRGDARTAGLFRSRFLSALLWTIHRDHYDDPLVRPGAVWRAPSWSWASMDGALQFEKCIKAFGAEDFWVQSHEEVATVLDLSVGLADPSYPWGGVTSGCLRLRGYLLPFKYGVPLIHIVENVHCVESYGQFEYYLDVPQWRNNATDTYEIMPLIRRGYEPNGVNFGCWGLILRPVSGVKYKRVGVCENFDFDWESVGQRRLVEQEVDIL
jgi:hypothetical protein